MMTKITEMNMPLRIVRKDKISHDIYLFELRRVNDDGLPEFTAGAHVTIQAPSGLARKYSLCNNPAERNRYLVAIKREVAGRGGSNSFIDETKVGDELLVTMLVNDFGLPPRAQDFIFIAGGIGITPIMAMIHEVLAQGKRFRLYYCTRSLETTAFLADLSKPEFKDKVTIHHDHGDRASSLDLGPILQERKNREHLYCCGPRTLMEAVRKVTQHWSSAAVHFEAFNDAETHKPGDRPFTVRLARSGETIEIPADKTILEVMRAKGHTVPSSCEGGTCGTCRTKLISGEADHRDLFLAADQRADHIMICVSRAHSTVMEIDH